MDEEDTENFKLGSMSWPNDAANFGENLQAMITKDILTRFFYHLPPKKTL